MTQRVSKKISTCLGQGQFFEFPFRENMSNTPDFKLLESAPPKILLEEVVIHLANLSKNTIKDTIDTWKIHPTNGVFCLHGRKSISLYTNKDATLQHVHSEEDSLIRPLWRNQWRRWNLAGFGEELPTHISPYMLTTHSVIVKPSRKKIHLHALPLLTKSRFW